MPPPIRAAAEFGVSYRPFVDQDLPFLAELYLSTRQEELAMTGWPAETQVAFLLQQHRAQHSHYAAHFADAEWLIIERAGRAIGRLYLQEQPDRFHVVDISLMPGSRGSGIGTAILVDVLAQARASGKRVSIHVEKNNRAQSLYARLGFSVIADRGVYDLLETAAQ